MNKYKVTITIEVNTEAVDYEEAEAIALDCFDIYSTDEAKADIKVTQIEEA